MAERWTDLGKEAESRGHQAVLSVVEKRIGVDVDLGGGEEEEAAFASYFGAGADEGGCIGVEVGEVHGGVGEDELVDFVADLCRETLEGGVIHCCRLLAIIT